MSLLEIGNKCFIRFLKQICLIWLDKKKFQKHTKILLFKILKLKKSLKINKKIHQNNDEILNCIKILYHIVQK